jgi:hypothetical protein
MTPPVTADDGIVDPLVVIFLATGTPTSCTVREKKVTVDLLDAENRSRSAIGSYTGCSGTTINRWLNEPRTHPCGNHPTGHRYPESVEVCEELTMPLPLPREVPA